MIRHPFVQPHPPQETCMTCNKPLLDPCHDTPYGKITKAEEENFEIQAQQQEEFEKLRAAKEKYK